MWVMRSVPATAGAGWWCRSGATFCPRNMPLKMAPAAALAQGLADAHQRDAHGADGAPELPVARDRTAHTMHAANKKICGCRIIMP